MRSLNGYIFVLEMRQDVQRWEAMGLTRSKWNLQHSGLALQKIAVIKVILSLPHARTAHKNARAAHKNVSPIEDQTQLDFYLSKFICRKKQLFEQLSQIV